MTHIAGRLMLGIFSPPIFADEPRNQRAQILFKLVLVEIGAVVAALLGAAITQPELQKANFVIIAMAIALGLLVLILNRRGWTTLGACLCIGGSIVLITYRAVHMGGVRSPGVPMFFLFALMAGLLFGELAGIAVGILCLLIGLGLVAAEQYGVLAPPRFVYNAQTYWWLHFLYMTLAILILGIASRAVKSSADHQQKELTERRKAEQTLNLALQAGEIGVWQWVPDTGTVIWDRRMREIFGISDARTVNFDIWAAAVFPDELEQQVAILNDTIRQHGHSEREFRIRRPDGETRHIYAAERALPPAGGEPLRVIGINIDITQKRDLESQLRQSQRLDSIGQMTGGVAHDFNNLLTVIMGNAETLERHLPAGTPLRNLASMTREAAEHGAELTERLLAFSRKQALHVRAVDVGELIRGMQGLLKRATGEQIEIRLTLAADLWAARTDAAQLESALLNLALNARDAMPRGGTLGIWANNAVLEEAGTGEFVSIAVSDTGIGMDEETRSRAFDPFFTTKDVGEGSGLGLSMVYGFVTQLKGHVQLSSEPGRGTTVRLYLPKADPGETRVGPINEDMKIVSGSEKILLVEDHELVRRQVSAQLSDLGYTVVGAADGWQALELLKTTPDFDLLFTDILMPRGLNGRDLAREAARLRPALPVLFTSGYADQALGDEDLSNPNLHLLTKPYHREVLAAKIRTVLDAPPNGAKA